ncbi:MAG: flagellar hook-associated protein 1 FlgK [Acidimicrobiales bacterium]|jgi:flagellar hook-associated protein 1 FlgK
MGDFSALNAAVTGLYAHRQRIDVISQNIANIDTPGYHRQVTHLQPIDTKKPGLFSGTGGQHGGVDATVARRWDQLLDTNAKEQRQRVGSLDTQLTTMAGLEGEIGLLGGGGLSDRLAQLWGSFDDLANDPANMAVRSVVIGNADGVASSLNHDANIIDTTQRAVLGEAELRVREVNRLASQIAELDRAIVSAGTGSSSSHGLLDRRDTMASQLIDLVDAQISHQANGQIRLTVDGHNLVADGIANGLVVTTSPDPELASLGYEQLSISSDSGRVLTLRGGELHGTLQLANHLIPEQRRSLDLVAEELVTTVNALHQAGYGLDGSTGNVFFDPAGVRAGNVAVSADLAANPDRLAASDGSGSLDNKVASSIAALSTAQTGPSALHAELLTDLGNEVRTLRGRTETASRASEHAEMMRQSAVGVSLDEELADLVSAQRAYEASSRMISTIDEMLDVLINRTGLVGR